MQTGIAAAVAAMDQAVRRLDTALAQRAGVFRRLAEQHGLMAAEVKSLRDELQASRDEAANLRERAALVDALRAELGQIQQDSLQSGGPQAGEDQSVAHAAALAARDAEIAALKAEREALQGQLAAVRDSQKPAPAFIPPPSDSTGDVAALKAELAAARAAQTEMQAFQSGIAARLEATMARLRQALDSQVKV
ncbi:MAG: hypothetical protein OJJ21_21355 [Ferrovibrio sp.]|uniref:hypothetical protein n=1 Tax=Ferrovibrio sp. TaxID=1917215 RepID=UPI002619B67C|nr:hypothetical protein [Ferrovibrio sp.]MCW0236159.1 hypothetical protein [Ferrovibrio sp.]